MKTSIASEGTIVISLNHDSSVESYARELAEDVALADRIRAELAAFEAGERERGERGVWIERI